MFPPECTSLYLLWTVWILVTLVGTWKLLKRWIHTKDEWWVKLIFSHKTKIRVNCLCADSYMICLVRNPKWGSLLLGSAVPPCFSTTSSSSWDSTSAKISISSWGLNETEWALGHTKLRLLEAKVPRVTGEENDSEVLVWGESVGGEGVRLLHTQGQKKFSSKTKTSPVFKITLCILGRQSGQHIDTAHNKLNF